MRTPNVAEQIRASREVKSNRDTDEVDRVKSKQTVEDSGQSGVDKVKPQAYHSLPSSPVSDVPAQSASRFLSIELQTLSVMSAREDIAASSRSCIASLADYLNANIETAERVIQDFRLDKQPGADMKTSSAPSYLAHESDGHVHPSYKVNVTECHEQVWRVMSVLLVGNERLWRLIRLFFMIRSSYAVNDTDDLIQSEQGKICYKTMIFELPKVKESFETYPEYVRGLVSPDISYKPGIVELSATVEWLGGSVNLWQFSELQRDETNFDTIAKFVDTVGVSADPLFGVAHYLGDIIAEFDEISVLILDKSAVNKIQEDTEKTKAIAAKLQKRLAATQTPARNNQSEIVQIEGASPDERKKESSSSVIIPAAGLSEDEAEPTLAETSEDDDVNIQQARRHLKHLLRMRSQQEEKKRENAKLAAKKKSTREKSGSRSPRSSPRGEKEIKGDKLEKISNLNMSVQFSVQNIDAYMNWIEESERDISSSFFEEGRTIWATCVDNGHLAASMYADLDHGNKDSFAFRKVRLSQLRHRQIAEVLFQKTLNAVPKFIQKRFKLLCRSGSMSDLVSDLIVDASTVVSDNSDVVVDRSSDSPYWSLDGLIFVIRVCLFRNTQKERDAVSDSVFSNHWIPKKWEDVEENTMQWLGRLKQLRQLRIRLPDAPKLLQFFLSLQHECEKSYPDTLFYRQKLAQEKSLLSVKTDDHVAILSAFNQFFSYNVTCMQSLDPVMTPTVAQLGKPNFGTKSDPKAGGKGDPGGHQQGDE